jgi:hypothetical protein
LFSVTISIRSMEAPPKLFRRRDERAYRCCFALPSFLFSLIFWPMDCKNGQISL